MIEMDPKQFSDGLLKLAEDIDRRGAHNIDFTVGWDWISAFWDEGAGDDTGERSQALADAFRLVGDRVTRESGHCVEVNSQRLVKQNTGGRRLVYDDHRALFARWRRHVSTETASSLSDRIRGGLYGDL